MARWRHFFLWIDHFVSGGIHEIIAASLELPGAMTPAASSVQSATRAQNSGMNMRQRQALIDLWKLIQPMQPED